MDATQAYHQHTETIATLPQRLQTVAQALTPARMALSYRPGGWTAAQIIHHLADSHLNAYTRLKLSLTEAQPTIKPYDQDAWAALPDAAQPDVADSLQLLTALHRRWAQCLRTLTPAQRTRTFYHPEDDVVRTIDEQAALYARHGDHHLAQLHTILTMDV